MKKIFFTAAALSIIISQTACFGSFALVKKVYEFNQSASNNKFVTTLLFYGLNIVPVYGVAAIVDVVILNLIEFWSGSNPVSMQEGEQEEQLLTWKGETYKMIASKNTMAFEKLVDGQFVDMGALSFSPEKDSWSMVKGEQSQEIIRFQEDGSADFQTLSGFQTFLLPPNQNLVASK